MSDATPRIDRGRFRQILRFFSGAILHIIWWDLLLRRVAPRRVRRSRPQRYRRIAGRFREMAVNMGGVMIKAGQFLSSRVDVLPPEITEELAGLQDEVPPEALDSVFQTITQELGRSPKKLFARFEEEPQAAASLGQTHRAWLRDGGETVVVKVQRRGIEGLVETDLAALKIVARWLMFYPPIRRRADVPALVAEFARTTWEELDYVAEASNAERFQEMFADDPGVCIPSVHRRFCSGRVLTLENVEQIKITDLEAIDAAGIDRSQVAVKLMEIYLRQVFEEGYFHADPHPGNLFIRALDGEAAPFQLIFVDFGMVGRVPSLVGEQLREIVFALALRDARRMVAAFQSLDFFLPGTDLERVEEATARLLRQFWGMSMEELAQVDHSQMQAWALEFRDLLFDMPFQVPQDFIFLGRAIGILSGLATHIDPHFNPWRPVEAFGQRLLRDQRRWPGFQEALKIVGETARPLLSLPTHLENLLIEAERGRLKVRVTPDRSLDRQLRNIESASRRLFWGGLFVALLSSGTILYVNQETSLGLVGWGLSGLTLLGALLAGRRRRP
jgi:predicted unusual protein kinase regulating ubiquinone biosynthesis (AarF/ABC1/UbiB family)